MKKKIHYSFILIITVLFLLPSCRSVEKLAVKKISNMMSSEDGAGAFTRDDDPRLIADALPFALKMYEMLLDMNPEDAALNLAAGKAFVMYANGFIQTPASMLDDEEYEQQAMMLERARKMYLRGRNYVIDGLCYEIKDGRELLSYNMDGLLEECKDEHTPYLYWAAAGWLGAFSCDPFNMEQGQDMDKPVAMLFRALDLDEEYSAGAVHDLLLTLWASMPRSILDNAIGKSALTKEFVEEYYDKFNIPEDEESRSRFHFTRAVDLSDGKNPGSYVSLAQAFPVMQQNYDEFESLLNKALAIDPYEDPDAQLLVIIFQEKAQWLLDHREDYFLMDF